MPAKNLIGLEAEYFLRGEKGVLVYPENYGLEYDDFRIIGEFRAEPGVTRSETVANFLKSWYDIIEKAKKAGKTVDISGFTTISPEKYTEILRKIGNKDIAKCLNIYPGTDLLKLTDAVVKDGVIESHKLSTGLHIHFSSSDVHEKVIKRKIETFSQVKIPLSIGNVNNAAEMSLYQKTGEKEEEDKLVASANRITKPVLFSIVKELDDKILPEFSLSEILKYRRPGFYEIKSHGGFEYRSLPFSRKVMDNIYNIVDFAFTKLEELDL